MSRYASADPTENVTLAEAKSLVNKRALVGLPNLGIFANAQGSQEVVEEVDFSANGIDPKSRNCLLIKVVDRPDREDSAAVKAFDDYINVGETLYHLRKAPNLRDAVVSMIENENNKIGRIFSPGEADRRISNIRSVSKAINEAFSKAWNAA